MYIYYFIQSFTNKYRSKHGDIEDDDPQNNPFEKKKRKKTSKVWNEYKTITANGKIEYECIHCRKRNSKMTSGCTSHLLRHMNLCTLRKIKLKGQKQLSVTAKNDTGIPESVIVVETFVYNHAKVREVFSHMLLVHELPFLFGEYELFNYFMKTATPNWEKIGRNVARTDCFSSHDIQEKKLRNY